MVKKPPRKVFKVNICSNKYYVVYASPVCSNAKMAWLIVADEVHMAEARENVWIALRRQHRRLAVVGDAGVADFTPSSGACDKWHPDSALFV